MFLSGNISKANNPEAKSFYTVENFLPWIHERLTLTAPINTRGSRKPIPYALFEEFISKRGPKQIFMIAWYPWEQGFIMATTEKDPNL